VKKLLLLVVIIAFAATLVRAAADAQTITFKIANWNIRSGMGRCGVAGDPCTFTDSTTNCVDASAPLNAWGYGLPQAVLATLNRDPEVLALGLEEAWGCGSSTNVRNALHWAYASPDYNGVALVTRFGISGSLQVKQVGFPPVDTEPRYVLGANVCVDAACSGTIRVYVAHLGGPTDDAIAVQASTAVRWLASDSQGGRHVLVGDFNVADPAPTLVPCGMVVPSPTLRVIRDAGYRDAWKTLALGDGDTATLNRQGCGNPVGGPWKRIDYAWYTGVAPLAMQRFGMVPAGYAAPSDHFGIVARFSGAVSVPAVQPPSVPPPASTLLPGTVVIRARDISDSRIAGNWLKRSDASAANGLAMLNPDAGAAKIATALTVPKNYFEVTFQAQAGTRYHLWLRLKATLNSLGNDSVSVQFNDAVTETGGSLYRIGTTSAGAIVLQESDGGRVKEWGWADNGWNGLGPDIYFAKTGWHTLRIQQREDGVQIDQIVLSSDKYVNVAPGKQTSDTTILK
jgi:endonuclease/exonuclease/phosphatase family metal-dependent hydrolase